MAVLALKRLLRGGAGVHLRLPVPERGNQCDSHIINPRRARLYWLTVLATFALGTAVGDFTATDLGLSYFPSFVLFGVIILIPLGLRYRLGVNSMFCFLVCLHDHSSVRRLACGPERPGLEKTESGPDPDCHLPWDDRARPGPVHVEPPDRVPARAHPDRAHRTGCRDRDGAAARTSGPAPNRIAGTCRTCARKAARATASPRRPVA